MPMFETFLNKLQEVSLSDINHELGKAKESLVFGSSNYLQNIREDAAQVGNLIRSESTRFGEYVGRIKPGLPKSTSLPVIQGREDGCTPCSRVRVEKYRYRSTVESPEEPIVSHEDLVDQESVVSRFIKVVGAQDVASPTPSIKAPKPSTREDIRKKLAGFGEEEGKELAGDNNNLEICFINETAIDETEDAVCLNPLVEESESEEEEEDNEEELEQSKAFPRSKSDWEAFRNPDLSKVPIEESPERRREERLQLLRQREERRKRKCQRAARLALAQCGQIARRQMVVEKERRVEESKLKKMLGLHHSQLNKDNLAQFNVSSLQFILNDLSESIETFNSELVQLLINKDDLMTEQESMLIDIEDISLTQ